MANNTQSDFQKAKLAATRLAKEALIEEHKEEFESLLNKHMEDSGYVARTVTKVVWEKEPGVDL